MRPAPPRSSIPRPAAWTWSRIHFGIPVADPYRWLENDVRTDPEVKAWVDAENAVTNRFLQTLPLRDWFKQRMTALYDYERFGLPVKKAGHYFYTHNSGLQNQAVLFVRDGLDGTPRQVIDPNGWSADGATALAEWTPSEDGKLLAYAIQDGGTDWRTVKVMDVATGKVLPDELKWLKYSGGVSWAKDGSGFYYSRFPAPAAKGEFQNSTLNNQRLFPQARHRAERRPARLFDAGKPEAQPLCTGQRRRPLAGDFDQRGGRRKRCSHRRPAKAGARPVALFTGLKNQWNYVGNEGNRFFFSTDKDAPMKRVAALDVGRPGAAPVTVIPEAKSALADVNLVGGKLIAGYLVDARSEVRVYDPAGKMLSTIDLPGLGSAGGFNGKDSDPETFFAFTSFNRPSTIYRYDTSTGQETAWAEPKLTFDPNSISVEQRFYTSKDGTRVPLFIVRKKGSTGPAPTLLYGYGGFNISITPSFSAPDVAWIERGGVYALANIRGGAEYGNAWHDAGRLSTSRTCSTTSLRRANI